MLYSQFLIDNRYNLFKTIAIYLSFFTIGCSTGLLGSSLLDLEILTSTTFTKISLLITFRSAGHVVGALIAGLIGSRFSESFILSVSSFASGFFIVLCPLLIKFELMASSIFIAGANYGLIDILSHTLLAKTWQEKCTNFLQVLQMCAGIGSLLSPVITRPFLLPSNLEDTENSSLMDNGSKVTEIRYASDNVKVHIAFAIVGMIGIVSSIPHLYFYFEERKACKNQIKQSKQIAVTATADTVTVTQKTSGQQTDRYKCFIMVTLVTIIGHAVYALEVVIGSLATPFSVKSDLHMDKKSGVLLATVFWSCFSFYRLFFIPLTFVISEAKLLATSLVISLIGLAITVPWANNNQTCIWVGFTLLGIGISPIFAASYGLLNKNISVTSRMTSIIFSMGIIGESFHPAVAAALMSKHMIIFLYYLAVVGIIYIVTFAILIIYCKKVFKSHLTHPQVTKQGSLTSISRF